LTGPRSILPACEVARIVAFVTAPLGIDPRDPQAFQELPWRSDSVRRTFAPRYLHSFGLRAVALRRAGRVAEADGMMVLEGGVFAFDIAEEAGSDLDETAELALVVDPAVGRLLVGWDANVSAENAISVKVPPEREPWVTVEIPLERARFAGRGPRETDVIVAAPGCEYAEGATGPDEIRIRDVSVRRPARAQAAENRTARLELTLLDEHGASTAARVGIYDVGSGREVLASADAVPILRYLDEVRDIAIPTSGASQARHAARLAAARLPRGRPMQLVSAAARLLREMPGRKTSWPAPTLAAAVRRLAARVRDRRPPDRGGIPPSRWMVYANGSYGVSVPPGAYEVIATRGPEYRHLRRRIEVAGSDIADVELRFERWRDLPAEGWWSGDAHVHIAREDGGDEAALSIARAEDLHVANLLAMGNIGAQYFRAVRLRATWSCESGRLQPGERSGGSSYRSAGSHTSSQYRRTRARRGPLLPVPRVVRATGSARAPGSHSMCHSASWTWWRCFRPIDFASTRGTTF
jgi:hypothetical protein